MNSAKEVMPLRGIQDYRLDCQSEERGGQRQELECSPSLLDLFDTRTVVVEIEPKAFFERIGYTPEERKRERDNMASIAALANQVRKWGRR